MIAVIIVLLCVIQGWGQKLEVIPGRPLPFAAELKEMLYRNVFNRSGDIDGRSIIDYLRGKLPRQRKMDDYDRLNISNRMDMNDLKRISQYVEFKLMAKKAASARALATRRPRPTMAQPRRAGPAIAPSRPAIPTIAQPRRARPTTAHPRRAGPTISRPSARKLDTMHPSRRNIMPMIVGHWDQKPLTFGLGQTPTYDPQIIYEMLNQTIYMTREAMKNTRKYRKLYTNNKVYYMGVMYGTLMMLRLKMTSHFNTMLFKYGNNTQAFRWSLVPYTKIIATHMDISQTVQRWFQLRDEHDLQLLKEYEEKKNG